MGNAAHELRSVRTTRHRIDFVHNKLKVRLGHTATGMHVQQSHGYVQVKQNPAVVKAAVANMATVFDDFEFSQENFKDYAVVHYRTKGSRGWFGG